MVQQFDLFFISNFFLILKNVKIFFSQILPKKLENGFKKKACERYQDQSEEEKNKKQEYGREQY